MTRLIRIPGWIGVTVGAVAATLGGKRESPPPVQPRRLFDALPGEEGRERGLFRAVDWNKADPDLAPEDSQTRSPRLRGRGLRLAVVAVSLPVAALVTALAAIAFFTASGAGAGNASVGTLNATTIGTHTAGGTSVSLDWSAVTAPDGGSVDGYYVLRDGSPAAAACGSPTSPITATSCTDTAPAVAGPVTYSYTVVTKWRSWTSTSAAVSVLVKGTQTISFTSTAPANAKVYGANYLVSATGGGSGNPVTFTIDASASSVCSISAGVVSFQTVGTCVVDANQAGNANWNAAAQVQQSFTVAKGDQTISFTSTAPANAKVGGATYTPTATATSGLAVTFTIDASASSVCSISAGVVSFQTVGTCVVDANQAGNANWNAAAQVQQSFTVAKGDQTISFTSTAPVNAKVGGATYTPTATATSGLAVTFTIDASASSVCSISAGVVSFQTVGTCVVDANQAGNANWNAAAQVQQSFTVAKGDQTISFTSTAPANAKVGGATYTPTATATSGLAVTFTIDASASSVCSISAGVVSFQTVGTCVVDANQAGNANWNAAAQVQQSFTVAKGDQTISFTSTAPANAKVGGATYTPTATATSGLAVTFTIDASASSVCSISAGVVSFQTVGTCVVDANQAGNANWNAAAQVQQSFTVAKGDQTISFTSTAPANAKVGGATYTPTATATSGLAVMFTIDASASSVCSISAGVVSFQTVGTCVVDANQAGNANWNAAAQVQQSFTVAKGDQTISFTSTAPATATVGGATYTATATASSGVTPVTFSSATPAVCTSGGTNGATFTFVSAGTCTVNGNQAGNANWNAATQAQQSFTVTGTAWVYNSTGAAQAWTSSTAKNVAYPAGTASGNLILLVLVQQNNTAAPTIASWTQLGTINKGNTVRLTVYWRASGGETSVSATPPADSAAWVVRYTGGAGAPTSAATAVATSANNGTTAAAPNVTTTGTNATVITFAGIPLANTLSLSAANSFTLQNAATSAGPATAFSIADRFVAATGSVTGPTWGQSPGTGDWALITGAFR